jgi:membrane protein DedA with SNARE-associated domain
MDYVVDAVTNLVHAAVSSPWIYPALLLCALLDGVLPVFPAETLVVTAGLYAAHGRPWLPGVVAAAAAGAVAGDHLSYLLGRRASGRVRDWTRRGRRRSAALEWAGRALAARGGLILVAARYVAAGRNATTLTMGAVRYPLRAFSLYDMLGSGAWALCSALLGYVGGVAFQRHPLQGLLLGLGAAAATTLAGEGVRRVRHGRRGGGTEADTPGSKQEPGEGPEMRETPADEHAA